VVERPLGLQEVHCAERQSSFAAVCVPVFAKSLVLSPSSNNRVLFTRYQNGVQIVAAGALDAENTVVILFPETKIYTFKYLAP
jgi:hypothetical protein